MDWSKNVSKREAKQAIIGMTDAHLDAAIAWVEARMRNGFEVCVGGCWVDIDAMYADVDYLYGADVAKFFRLKLLKKERDRRIAAELIGAV